MNSIREVSHDGAELTIIWEDASESRLLAIWLRDQCQMPASRNPECGQPLLNITDISPDLRIERINIEDGRLVIEYAPDGYRSEFDPDWLYHNCYCLNRQPDDRSAANKVLWSGDSFAQGLPRYSYDAFCAQPASKLATLKAVRDWGFVLLDEVPCESGQLLKVIDQFGYVRETSYGPFFEVRTRVDPDNPASTNPGFGCHLDNPYRDPIPGLQLLHCLESSTTGGETILQDGFTAARVLCDENPEHFAILSQHWVSFRFRDSSTDLQARVPLIEVNDLGDVIKVHFDNRSIETLRLPPEVMQRFYPAYRHYAEILQRETLQIDFNLQPGELMLFDSTRVFHASKACLAVGTQHLQGAYSDLDGLYSCLRLLEQQA